MSSAKETPRQKMIGMMYLVLTAMLALNVSAEVLKSFTIVNDSMTKTNENFEKKVGSIYAMFNKAYLSNPEKLADSKVKIEQVQKHSKEMLDYVSNLKYELIMYSEGIKDIEQAKLIDKNSNLVTKPDNFDDPTRFMIDMGNAKELKEKIEAYKSKMLSLLEEKDKEKVSLGMDTKGPFEDASGAEVSWEDMYFNHTIIVADLTMLNKIIAELLNAEYDMVAQLYASVSDEDFKFDQIGAKLVSQSNYVLVGDMYEADIFVAAYDSKSKISATINGTNYLGNNGVVHIKFPATSEGVKTVQGVIRVPSAIGGGSAAYDFKEQYIVAKPSSAITLEQMNVFYAGVDNPISLAASGVDLNDLRPTINNGTLTPKGNGKYIVKVSQTGKTTINLIAQVGNKAQSMGSFEFRVKRIPDPIPVINGLDEDANSADKNILANAGGIRAYMKDFDFAVTPQIKSFTMQTQRGSELSPTLVSNGNRFTDDMVNLIKQARRGQKVFFEEIKANMPDGTTRSLNSIIITVK